MSDIDHKTQCEAEHGTAHLPEDVRASIYRNTNWETEYEDAAEVALLAYKAGIAAERERIVASLNTRSCDGLTYAPRIADRIKAGEL